MARDENASDNEDDNNNNNNNDDDNNRNNAMAEDAKSTPTNARLMRRLARHKSIDFAPRAVVVSEQVKQWKKNRKRKRNSFYFLLT